MSAGSPFYDSQEEAPYGGDGASSNSLHGDDGSWGELSITAILRPGREHRKTTRRGRLITHTEAARRRVGCPACRGPEIRAGLRFDHVWIGFMAPAAGCWPRAQ